MNSNEGHQKTPKTIVGQLLDARSESEEAAVRSTKVIVDENGNKVVQVRKRKRVYSEEEKTDREQKNFKNLFLGAALLVVLLLMVFGGLFIFRASTFNSSDFQSQKEKELSALWGANVTLLGLKVEGFSFKVGALRAEFPETSMIKSVELQAISGDLKPQSFMTGRLQGNQFYAHSVNIVLRNKAYEMNMPLAKGEDLWKFDRFVTDNFNLSFEDTETEPFSITKCQLYGKSSSDIHILQLEGMLTIKGWTPMKIQSPMIYVSKVGLEQININGTMGEGTVAISGSILNGQPVYGRKFQFNATKVRLSDLTKKAFIQLFDGELGDMKEDGDHDTKMTFTLPTSEMPLPAFNGEAKTLSNVDVQKLDMLKELGILLSSGLYSNPIIENASLQMVSDGKAITVRNIDFESPKVLKIKGQLKAEMSGPLQGELLFGVPVRSVLLPIKGKGDMLDPLFKLSDGGFAWVAVKMKGTQGEPLDNVAELVKAASASRSENSDRSQEFLRQMRDGSLNSPGGLNNQTPSNYNNAPSAAPDKSTTPFRDNRALTPGGGSLGTSSNGFDELIR